MSRNTSSSAPVAGIALGELGRIAGVDKVDEPGALDDAAVGHVEARDDAPAEHQPASPTTLAISRRPSSPDRSGWNWTPSRRPRATAETNGRAVPGRGERGAVSGAPSGCPDVRVDEVEVRVRVDAVERRMRARPLDLVPADVREGRARRRGGRSGRAGRPASPRRPRRCPRTGAGGRGRCRGTGGRRRSSRGSASTKPALRSRSIAGAAAPTPGTTRRSAPSMLVRRRRAADARSCGEQGLLDRDEVARRRSRRPRRSWAARGPLIPGSPWSMRRRRVADPPRTRRAARGRAP